MTAPSDGMIQLASRRMVVTADDLTFEPPVARRGFDPSEPRDPHSGKWGIGSDALKLAGSIDLAHDEHLVSSGHLKSNGGTDVDLVHAVFDSPRGRELRVGVVHHEDIGKWRAADKGGTVKLTPRGAAHLRDDLTEANRKAKAAAKKADAVWNAGGTPDVSAAVVEGRATGTWGELAYTVHLTDDDPTSWVTTIKVHHGGAGDGSADGASLTPKDLTRLIKTLGDATG